MSHKTIEKTNLIASDILSTSNIADYPLDWTRVNQLPKWAEVSSGAVKSPDFNSAEVNFDHMTHERLKLGLKDPTAVLQKLNILNPIWQKINLVRMGFQQNGEKGLDITRSFFMVDDGDSKA